MEDADDVEGAGVDPGEVGEESRDIVGEQGGGVPV